MTHVEEYNRFFQIILPHFQYKKLTMREQKSLKTIYDKIDKNCSSLTILISINFETTVV